VVNEHVRTSLAAIWTAIRERHPSVPEVVIVLGNPDGLCRDPAWGHQVYPRNTPGGGPGLQYVIDPDGAERVGAERVLQQMLYEAAHGLGDGLGINVHRTSGGLQRHTRRFAPLCRVGLRRGGRCHRSARETVRDYRQPVAALIAAIDQARLEPASDTPDRLAACACRPTRHLLVAARSATSAAPTCPGRDHAYRDCEAGSEDVDEARIRALRPPLQQGIVAPKVSSALNDYWDALRENHSELPVVRIVPGEADTGSSSLWGHRTVRRTGPLGDVEIQLAISFLEIQDAPAEVIALAVAHDAVHGIADSLGLADFGSLLDWRPGVFHNRHFRAVADEVGLECRFTGRDTGWQPIALTKTASNRYALPILALQTALEDARRYLFPVSMAARCSCGLGRILRSDSRTLADAPPHCPVCDRPYRPTYFDEL
jgi:hypothetical protein